MFGTSPKHQTHWKIFRNSTPLLYLKSVFRKKKIVNKWFLENEIGRKVVVYQGKDVIFCMLFFSN